MSKIPRASIFLFLIFSLKNGYSLENILENELRQAYQHLEYSHHGLDYPRSKEILDICVNNKIEPCLRVYHKVKEAKQVILTHIKNNRQKTFQVTVNTLVKDCAQPDRQHTCFGAVVTLYFFNEEQEDNKLLKILAGVTPKILESLFLKRFEWYFNRSDPDK